jgi:hypothetical protein
MAIILVTMMITAVTTTAIKTEKNNRRQNVTVLFLFELII